LRSGSFSLRPSLICFIRLKIPRQPINRTVGLYSPTVLRGTIGHQNAGRQHCRHSAAYCCGHLSSREAPRSYEGIKLYPQCRLCSFEKCWAHSRCCCCYCYYYRHCWIQGLFAAQNHVILQIGHWIRRSCP